MLPIVLHHGLLGSGDIALGPMKISYFRGIDRVIAQLGMADRVAALLTITTPHRGSSFADWCVENVGEKLGCARLLTMMGLDVRAINDLTTSSCRRFNREVKNVAGVQYFSVSAA